MSDSSGKSIQTALQLFKAGDFQQAKKICKKLIKKQPRNADLLHFLGFMHSQIGKYDSAITYMKKAIRVDPTNPFFHMHVGNVHQQRGEVDEAIDCYQKALQHDPDNAEAYYNLGTAFLDKTYLDDAIASFQKALQNNSTDPDTYNNLGVAFRKKGNLDAAIACFQKALQLNHHQALTHYNLGYTLMKQDKLEEAIQSFRNSLAIDPDSAVTLENLGSTLVQQGKLNEAEGYYKLAIQKDPNYLLAHQASLMILNYNPLYDAQMIFLKHREFTRQHADYLSSALAPYANDRSVTRKLRIGYVSADFKRHSVAYFIEPVLAAHNKEQVSVYCYADVGQGDEVTERLRGYADCWRSIMGMTDEQVAGLIRNDSIDILVDLSGHTAQNRMLVFARKPAPMQVSWIGYPATTGLSTIDYKIVDHYTDPPGLTERFYTENLIRLPECFLCYRPYSQSPEIGNLPAEINGYITFGSCNNFTKVSSEILALWSCILKKVTRSRLLLKTRSFADGATYQNTLNIFAREGITDERIILLPRIPSLRGHFDTYNQIDIALDTFPYNGTTTSCEALWMGVPVISLAGDIHASRVGASLLSNCGLPDLIAKTPAEYVEIAAALSANIIKLQYLRNNLRGMMARSPLTDAKRFIIHLEDVYRTMWEKWCEAAETH